MTKGKKTGGRDFLPGNPGSPGRPPIPESIKALRRQLRSMDFAELIMSTLYMTDEEIKKTISDHEKPQLDKIMAKAVENARLHGNYSVLSSILDRVLGKVPDKVESTNSHEHSMMSQVTQGDLVERAKLAITVLESKRKGVDSNES